MMSGRRRVAIAGFAIATIGAGVLGLAASPTWAGIVRLALAPLCHQRPDRSFTLAGHLLAVCHRCTGIYAGLFVGGLLAMLGARVPLTERKTWLVAAGPLLAQAIPCTVLPSVRPYLDFVWLRVATGLLFGAVAGIALSQAFAEVIARGLASRVDRT